LFSIYLLEHIIEGKREGRIEVKERVTGRRKPLLDDFKKKRRFWKLKEEALYRTLWWTHFAWVDGPVVRHITEWMTWYKICSVMKRKNGGRWEHFSSNLNNVQIHKVRWKAL